MKKPIRIYQMIYDHYFTVPKNTRLTLRLALMNLKPNRKN